MEQDFKCCSLQFSIIVYLQCRDNSLKLSKSNLLYFVKISCQKGDGYFFKVISLQYTELLIIDVKIKCLPLVFVSILVFVFVFVFYCLFIVNGHSISVIMFFLINIFIFRLYRLPGQSLYSVLYLYLYSIVSLLLTVIPFQ